MKLGYLQDVYDNRGPFVTVYLDTSGNVEDASRTVGLRWRSAREQLSADGASEEDLGAVDEVVGAHQWRAGQRGQLVIAAGGEVVFRDELPDSPEEFSDDELARVGPLPHLMPYLRLRSPRVPYVLGLVDRTGADVHVVDAGRHSGSVSVEGESGPVHKSHTAGEGHEKSHHDAVEEQWRRNAEQVAAAVDEQALRVAAETIVLAGERQIRRMVHDQLRKGFRDRVVATEAGHRDRNASEQTLQREVAEAVDAVVREQVDSAVQDFERELGQRDRAVDGWADTVTALQRGQVGTLLRSRSEVGDPPASLWIGPDPKQIALDRSGLAELGVSDPEQVSADEALVRALVGTDAELVLVDPERKLLTAGIGAVLRYTESGGGG
ncbi:baeRF2 domain-containing protein [Actinopolyspora saharensis]|uniref:baeRF2 domain-containing protein n=1 Tax=Actinopolyspora saharensis TaxID=995062 RepID=UPI003F680C49